MLQLIKKITIDCGGLLGGHSGIDIIGRASALKIILDLYDEIKKDESFASINFQLISGNTNTTVVNSIAQTAQIVFAIDTTKITQEKLTTAIDNVKTATLAKYTKEDSKNLSITSKIEDIVTDEKALSSEASKTLMDFMPSFFYGYKKTYESDPLMLHMIVLI